ncbi:MAG: hypothetical protein KKI09_05460 [Spirochaetes bacterium]|nr:hypothetical protein [Spirochaetota bacterium]
MRLSVPSYVIPGTWLENARFLAEQTRVRHVELLFFMYDDETRRLADPEWAGLRELAATLEYTLHLPDVIQPQHEALIQLSADFVQGYVVHPPRDLTTLNQFAELLLGWQQKYPVPFRLENTRAENFQAALQALREHGAATAAGTPGIALCLDLGHLLLEGHQPLEWLERHAPDIQELHLHGLDGKRDHQPFDGSEDWFKTISPWLKQFNGIVELELFDWKLLQPILRHLEAL